MKHYFEGSPEELQELLAIRERSQLGTLQFLQQQGLLTSTPAPQRFEEHLNRLALPAAEPPQHPQHYSVPPQQQTQYPQYQSQQPTQHYSVPQQTIPVFQALPRSPRRPSRLWLWCKRHPGYAVLSVCAVSFLLTLTFNNEFRGKAVRFLKSPIERSTPSPAPSPPPAQETEIPIPVPAPEQPSPEPEASPPAPEQPSTDSELLRDKLKKLEQPVVP